MVERMGGELCTWMASLLKRGGRLELVKAMLAEMLIFPLMSLDVRDISIVGMVNIWHGILWAGKKDASGRHYRVAWDKVGSPIVKYGLGIPNLKYLNISLRSRWR
jgi:hypothetical protein